MPRLGGSPLSTRSLQALARQLPLPALLPLGAAIFCLFAVLGPVVDVVGGGKMPIPATIRIAVLSGLWAVGYAYGTLRRNWYVFSVTTASHLLWTLGLFHETGIAMPARSSAPAELRFDGLGTMLLVIGSYTCFLWFVNGTAARYLRVRAEMDLAHEIHKVLVPAVSGSIGPYEFFGVSDPSGEVGGDLVDVVDSGTHWFGYVADVSGHGVSSGVVMGMFKSALRMSLHRGTASISTLLDDLNAVLFPLKSGAMYVTAACVRASVDGAVEFSVAGHLPILRCRGGRVDELTTPQIPVGMFENYRFTSATVECVPGDLLALLTDGLTEVFDRADRELGIDAVKAIVAASAGRPLSEIAEAIVARARTHGPQLDDQTLLLIRRSDVEGRR